MFRFTIRDVLWLMVVVALAVAWLLERPAFYMGGREVSDRRTIQTMSEEIEELKAKVREANRTPPPNPATPFDP